MLFLIDRKLVFGWRLHRQVARLLAFKNAIDVISCASVLFDCIGPIRHQAAACSEITIRVDRGQSVPRCKGNDLIAIKCGSADRHHQPTVGERANSAIPLSISETSSAFIGLNSIPSAGATAWTTANWPIPGPLVGSRMTAARVT